MQRFDHTLNRAASRHLARAASLLNRAEHHLSAASSAAPDRYHQRQLHGLAHDLREIDAPLSQLSSALDSGCDQ